MPIIPSLASLAAGVASGIGQNQKRQQAVLQTFADNTQLLGESLKLNDNLQFRRLFSQPDADTPFQSKLDNVIANARDPGVGIQALLASTAASQPLATRALQNPSFGLSQGIPRGFENQLSQGFFGINPLLQDRSNQQQLSLLGQVPTLAQTGYADLYGAQAQLAQGNAAAAASAQTSGIYLKEIERLIKLADTQARQIATLTQQGVVQTPAPRNIPAEAPDALPTNPVN